MRVHFEQGLQELRNAILMLGSQVGEELDLAVAAYRTLDSQLAEQVLEVDRHINDQRYAIEDRCVELIVTQQPMASDLRAILTALHMATDLERMGDQAKGIAKLVPRLQKQPKQQRPPQLLEMASLVRQMLDQSMKAYAEGDVAVATALAAQDDKVDALYTDVFCFAMTQIADADDEERVEAAYELLRTGRELERFGDLATNLSERVLYLVTGSIQELNPDAAGREA